MKGIVRWGWVVCIVAVVQGCGGFEETPRSVAAYEGGGDEESRDDRDAAGDESGEAEEESQEAEEEEPSEVVHPFVVPDEEEHEARLRCGEVCFKASWCSEGAVELGTCMEECEEVEETGLIQGPVMECLVGAESCVEVGQCEAQVEICTEICGFYDYCGFFDEGAGCHSWCVGQMWSGHLGWEEVGCLDQAGRDGDCEALTGGTDRLECGSR